MAMVWMESAQRLRTNALVAGRYGAGAYSATSGRDGGPAIGGMSNGNVVVYPKYPVPSGTKFFGGFRINASLVSNVYLFGPCWNGVKQVYLSIRTNGSIWLSNDSVQLGTDSPAGTIKANVLQYIAMEATIASGTGGSVRVLVDGTEVLNVTGVNTKPQAGGLWNSFGVPGSYYFCDMYVADETNTSGNDICTLVPDMRVDYLLPNGDGYSSQFVGSDGDSVNNSQHVDDTTPDDDATYVQSSAAAIDGYALADLPAMADPNPVIKGVCSYARARKTDAGVAQLKASIRSGTTNGTADAQALPITYTDVYQHFSSNPAGGAFTKDSINALQQVTEKV